MIRFFFFFFPRVQIKNDCKGNFTIKRNPILQRLRVSLPRPILQPTIPTTEATEPLPFKEGYSRNDRISRYSSRHD